MNRGSWVRWPIGCPMSPLNSNPMSLPSRLLVWLGCWLQFAAVGTLLAEEPAIGTQRPAPAAPAAVGAKRLPLWEVRSGTAKVYLLGSVHFMKENSYPLAPPIEEAVRKAEVVAFETDLDAMNEPDGMLKMLTAGQCPEGQTLKELIDAPLYARVQRRASASGLPVETLSGFRPWLVAVTFATLDLQKQGYNPLHGVDHHYHEVAKEAKKRVVGLETVEAQLSFFTQLGPKDEAAFLAQTLDDMDKLKSMMDQMMTAWRTGDAPALDRLMNESMKGQPALYKRLLVDRNASWIPQIEKMLREGRPAVVIVGCAHLVGKDSVVEMLRKKGLTVEQQFQR